MGVQLCLFPWEDRDGTKTKAPKAQPLYLATWPVLADRVVADPEGAWLDFASYASGALEHFRDLAANHGEAWRKGSATLVLEVHCTWYRSTQGAEAASRAATVKAREGAHEQTDCIVSETQGGRDELA